jgi:DNA-binding NarL/FixJ family response regulator
MRKQTMATGIMPMLMSLKGCMANQIVGRAGGIACGKSDHKGGARYSVPMLTGREREIKRVLAEARTLAIAAEVLDVSRQTLRLHMTRMGLVKTRGMKK